ncbi:MULTISPECIES: energy transducer TonB [unclassified Methylophaga]|jgi:protein TonB|uniref:energy transducer TonB n=2 Tax=Methylophaga TaxID=40222 RepID=UPI000C3D1F1B|nr:MULTISPECIES: energy transducer TonB [unclassified Methylophaga]MAL48621.1 energy transducer TonB [Methylophaga sp.]MBP26310.1 energy transducer TonB [Methylophaga sp.]|tara:strand:+ start:279 stop:1316 length:1038 start_codon:yes stop_codon:yes gene_type:complete
MISTSSATDRMILTLIGSVILHVIVVFTISFNVFSPPTNAPVNQLDITLVKQQTEQAPEEASYLAQVNNEGGGETDEKSPEPTPELAVPIAEETPASTDPVSPAVTELDPVPVEPVKPEPVVEPAPPVEPSTPAEAPAEKVVPEPPAEKTVVEAKPEPKTTSKKVTAENADRKVETSEIVAEETVEETAEITPNISGAELIARARSEIGSLQSTLEYNSRALSETPKKRRISAATKEYSAAAYMRAWAMKVERIGNMNYPQEAKDKGVNGSLMLSVDIKPDGSVPPDGIVVSRSSGHKVLDDAAVRIVRLGAPYAAIPEDVLQNNDMLTIIRTWKFESARGLSAR